MSNPYFGALARWVIKLMRGLPLLFELFLQPLCLNQHSPREA